MTWLIYLIGIKQIILLMEIQNDCKICDFVDIFEVRKEKQEDKL